MAAETGEPMIWMQLVARQFKGRIGDPLETSAPRKTYTVLAQIFPAVAPLSEPNQPLTVTPVMFCLMTSETLNTIIGASDGTGVGALAAYVGSTVGAKLGLGKVGTKVGVGVGRTVGRGVGERDALDVGIGVGTADGTGLGWAVG